MLTSRGDRSACGRRCFASLLSALAFNFFFLPPLYTFTIADPENVVALVFFLVVAVIASNLTARVQRQAVAARKRARTTEDLYLFSQKLAGIGTLDDLLWATAFQIASMLKVRVVLLLPEDGTIAVQAGYPPEDTLDEADLAAAHWAGSTTARPAAAPTRCRGRSACSCRCAPAAPRSASSASTATARARCSRPSSSGCSMRLPTRRRSPSSASSSSPTSTGRGSPPRPTGCARRC